jgi:mannose-6-phosphate isomerase
MHPLILKPEYREYIWGGNRLRPHHPIQTAEAWVVYEQNRIEAGRLKGKTLAQAAVELGKDLLGGRVMAHTGDRFPLLIKLLDCAEWLSLQVHPDDEQARRLEGEGHFGKTEAWHILEADVGAQLIAGTKKGVSAKELQQAIRTGKVIDCVQYLDVHQGDTLLMLPGTLHALGPGLLIYEVQQTSDITYRVYDWDRPQTAERRLHIDESIQVADAQRISQIIPMPDISNGVPVLLCQSDYFQLQFVSVGNSPLKLNTGGNSFHALTAIQGQGAVIMDGERFLLNRFDSIVIPAVCGEYTIQPTNDEFNVLLAHP